MTQPDGLRTITLEEHFATPAFLDGAGRRLKEPGRPDARLLLRRLQDLGDGRIAEMDAAGIDVQVLSLTAPGTEQLPPDEARALASEANAALAEAIGRHPDRFAGFAVVPTPDPERAADELERAVRQLGFKGAVVNGHVGGRYLDDPFFWPLFERAEALGVPIYLHPTPPPEPVAATYYRGHFPPAVAEAFATHGWGWHIESALHVLRIVLGGVFDRYPRLQLIMGHLGETLPFMLERLSTPCRPASRDWSGRSETTSGRTSTTRSAASPTCRPSSTCCCRWERTASSSRPTIPSPRWRAPAPSLAACP